MAWSCAAPTRDAALPSYPWPVQKYIDHFGKGVRELPSLPPVVERALARAIEAEGPWEWHRCYGGSQRVCFATPEGYCVVYWDVHDQYWIHDHAVRFDQQGRLLEPMHLIDGGILSAASIDP